MPRRVLVVLTAPDPGEGLLGRLELGGDDAEVLVVAPASDVSFGEWLVSDEDEARLEAERRVQAAARSATLGTRVVDARVGDTHPLVAVEDALRTFPADELVLVTRPAKAATWLEQEPTPDAFDRFGLPVRHVVDEGPAPDDQHGSQLAPPDVGGATQTVARGESPWTALLVPNAVLLAVMATVGVVIAVALALYLTLR